jgi:hypothetical protein
MPLAGFEPTTSLLERAKTDHALDCAATVIGRKTLRIREYMALSKL